MLTKQNLGLAALLVTLAGFAAPSFATGTDFSSITSAVDFSGVVTGIIAVAALAIVVVVAWAGAKMLVRAARSV